MDDLVSSLLCQEKEAELVDEDEEEEDSYFEMELGKYCSVSEEEYVHILMEREMGFGFKREEDSSLLGDWVKLKTPRLDAINWILKVITPTNPFSLPL
ncbi:cyclin-D5-1 isoform X2 [Senna tora]|uniref:Cyclin-D5-1 isoform X2 n=1 Tax=Senna tora TaxID=362788 RepID=A0A834U1G8_9FABA|nr:cyclin-D5-1 isoform X2 [Senna tora]